MMRFLQYNLNLFFQNNLKITFAFNLVVSLWGLSSVNTQIENQNPVATDFKKHIEIQFEKVYLHLDRPYYSAGDDIWIKAYLVDALTNKLSDNSNNLNVELISPESKIIKRLILRIDSGIGFGDFHLGDSIASGDYQVRAYTSWMRNFGDVFFFKKDIVIENHMGITASKPSKPEENDNNVDVQFFPESGPLIENVYTVMSFKAVSSSGYGCNVNGQVFSSLGDTLTSFVSTHLGMGRFFFLPKKGLKYFAVGNSGNGIPFRVELPTALETGYSLKVSDFNENYFRVTIKTNQETLNQFPLHELVIAGTSHDSICVITNVTVRATDNMVIIPKKKFPEGVSLITLIDTIGRTYCERVFYIHGKKNYSISIVSDNEVYAPKQKVTLQISVRDNYDKPASANLSLSVVDGSQIEGFEKKPDISSYLLLESEISGYIEQPFYYFDTTIPDRYQALDNLLLTQGWRNYVWSFLSDTTIRFKYPVEKGISVSGKLRRVLIDKPIEGVNISMAMSENVSSSSKFTQTDSVGKYSFDGLNFTGSQNILIYAADKKDIGKGLILFDSIFRDPAPISYNQVQKIKITDKKIPNNNDVQNHDIVADNNEISDFKKEAARKYNIMKQYHITDTIGLYEVVINARRPVKENADGHYRPYGEPDISLPITELMYSNKTVFDIMQGQIPGFFQGRFVRFGPQKTNQPLFLLDGLEVDEKIILDLQVSDVDKIEVIKDAGKLAFFGFRASYGVISVFTKKGRSSPVPPLNFINQRIYGYYQARTFYSPKYNVPQPEYNTPDLRTTIHWEPNVVTDKDGNATISFFNADNKAIIKVDVEGVAERGVPLAGKASFKVK